MATIEVYDCEQPVCYPGKLTVNPSKYFEENQSIITIKHT